MNIRKMNFTDWEIVEQIKKGDIDKFALLIDKYKDFVFKTINGFLMDEDMANDLTQEVFIKLWENLSDLQPKAKLSTWLYRVAVNHSINFLKRRKFMTLFSKISSQIQKSTDDETLDFDFADSNNFDFQIENKELIKILKKALKKLPKRQKIAFVLNKFNGMSYKDIAEVMNLSYSAVDSLINRAKNNLKKYLKKYQNYEL